MSNNKKEDKEAEIEVYNRFSRIVKEKFSAIADGSSNGSERMNNLDVLYQNPEFTAEKKILGEMNNIGLSKGILAGLGCFAFLRISPRLISKALRRRAGVTTTQGGNNPFHQSSKYKLDPPPNPLGGQQNVERLERPGLAFRLMRLSLDTFVSLSIGAYTSLWFVDKDKMMRSFSDIPLVEGRSLLSEELCGDFTREFKKLDTQVWDRKRSTINHDEKMNFRNTIQGFVVNCQRRAICEDEMRKERGMRDDEPVVIPSPGVSRDISINVDDLLGSGETDDNSTGEDYFDEYFDMGDMGGESDRDGQID